MNARRRQTTSRFGYWFSSQGRPLLIVAMLVVAAGAGSFAILSYANRAGSKPAPPSREGLIAVPKSVRAIPAYAKIRREDIYDLNIGDESYYWMTPERVQANPDWVVNPAEIIGRVMAKDKEEGYVFSRNNFLPEGTRPGVVAGIPTGKRSMTVSVDQVPGLESLNTGDRFDLLISRGNGESGSATGSSVELATLLGGVKPEKLQVGQRDPSGKIRVLVQDGMLISVEQPAAPASNRRQSAPTTAKATIAIAPFEVAPLSEALSTSTTIFCVARSGQPEDSKTDEVLAEMIAIPALSRTLPAYSEITESDLADPATGELNIFYFPADRLNADWLAKPELLIGRVINRELKRGHLFTEADLMPEGTRPGLVAGAPVGKQIYVVPAGKVRGLSALGVGDHVTIYATIVGEVPPSPPSLDWATIMGGALEPESEQLSREVRAGISTIAKDALVVSNDGDSVALAIAPEDVTSMSQSLNRNADMFAVAKSGQDGERSQTPEINAEAAHLPKQPPQKQSMQGPDPLAQRLGKVDEHFWVTTFGLESEPPQGWIAYPVTAKPIRAYERLKIEDFVDPSTGKLRIYYFPPDKGGKDWIADLDQLLDRVISADFDSGRVIAQGDLLPEGSRPGPSAGIPTGWRAISVTNLEIAGLESVREGDRIDLLLSEIWNAQGRSNQTQSAGGDWAPKSSPSVGGSRWSADVNVVARNALVVAIAQETREQVITAEISTATREVVTPGGLQREGTETVAEPRVLERQVIVCSLAVPAEMVPSIAAALEFSGRIVAVARSGNAEEVDVEAEVPKVQANVFEMEHIRGTNRDSEIWLRKGPSIASEQAANKLSQASP